MPPRPDTSPLERLGAISRRTGIPIALVYLEFESHRAPLDPALRRTFETLGERLETHPLAAYR